MVKKSAAIQFSQLVNMHEPAAVFEAVKCNFIRSYPINAFQPVREAFVIFNHLYDGSYPGYHHCNTRYHDKIHTTDALLAISRLMDGYNIAHPKSCLPLSIVQKALVATIFHDTGYIQRHADHRGTGAKYTLNHVERSIEFIADNTKKIGFTKADAVSMGKMVQCTGLFSALNKISFATPEERTVALMLGSADIIGQMASRTYLERLLFLYREFEEGHVRGYSSEQDLLLKTIVFYDKMMEWLTNDLHNVQRFAGAHFKKVYRINKNMYQEAMDRHIAYLRMIAGPIKQGKHKQLLRRKVIIR